MASDESTELLREIKSLLAAAADKQDRSLRLQEEALERQREGLSHQAHAIEMSANAMKRQKIVLFVVGVTLVVLVPLLLLSALGAIMLR